MDIYTIQEEAYKRGYEAGVKDAVVHGRWIDTGKTYEDEKCRYNYWECSECNNQIAGRYGLHNYCPNCGAKMDEPPKGELVWRSIEKSLLLLRLSC